MTGERVTVLAVACGHPEASIRVIDNAVHEYATGDGNPAPLLLWCATCGSLAWSDGSLVAVVDLRIMSPGPSAWLPPYVRAERGR